MRFISKSSFVSLLALTLISASACVTDASQSAGEVDVGVCGTSGPGPSSDLAFDTHAQGFDFEVFERDVSILKGSVPAWGYHHFGLSVPGQTALHVTAKDHASGTVVFDQDVTTSCNGVTLVSPPTVEISAVIETGKDDYTGVGLPLTGLGGAIASGELTDELPGIYCGTDGDGRVHGGGNGCKWKFIKGSTVKLNAVPAIYYAGVNNPVSTYEFQGWEGCPQVSSDDPKVCLVQTDKAMQVKAKFDLTSNVSVFVSKLGLVGSVVITSDVGGMNCGDDCSHQTITVARGTQVTVTVIPGNGMVLDSWASEFPSDYVGAPAPACSGSSLQCTFTATQDVTHLYPVFKAAN